MENNDIYSYITTEINNYKTNRVPLTRSKDWSMFEHIERCTNVSNGWFHSGKNDGLRPYDDLATPIIDVSFRSEGFDVKDIQPFVDDVQSAYKSFLVKKFHPDWATKNELDTFIDDVVETSVIYDLALIKDINNVRPEVVDLKTIAFCDQTDVMSGPICLRHEYTIAELTAMKGKWNADNIDIAIAMAKAEKENALAGDRTVKTPSKYMEVFELRGRLPSEWLDGEVGEYSDQMHIITYYTDSNGSKNGVELYKGKDKPLNENFFALKIDRIRSKGRACGRSIVERLFEPQTWNNYSGIQLKKILDSTYNLIISDSEELGNQKLSDLKTNTILKQEKGAITQRFNSDLNNITAFQNYSDRQYNSARLLGSASEGSLGVNPSSGTPFALQELIVNQGEGIHVYRQGKIATFFADVLYPKLILPYLLKEMNSGKKFSEELSLDEIAEIAETISSNLIEQKIKDTILKTGEVPTNEEREMMKQSLKDDIMGGKTPFYQNGRGFMELMKDDINDIPIKVKINVAGKQKYLARDADKLSKLISMVIANPQAFATIPGLSKPINQLIESAGMSPIDFKQVISGVIQAPDIKTQAVKSPVEESEVEKETL